MDSPFKLRILKVQSILHLDQTQNMSNYLQHTEQIYRMQLSSALVLQYTFSVSFWKQGFICGRGRGCVPLTGFLPFSKFKGFLNVLHMGHTSAIRERSQNTFTVHDLINVLHAIFMENYCVDDQFLS